jgi:L-malate glycosyltransferase
LSNNSKRSDISMGNIERTLTDSFSAPEAGVLGLDAAHGERIRLLKVVTNYGSGGTEKQVMNLVRQMDMSRFDLQFGCLKKWGIYVDALEQQNIPISEFRIGKLYQPTTFRQQFRFAQFLRQQNIQIVHSYNFYSNVFAVPAAKMAGVPVVLASIRDQGVYLSEAQKRVQKWACRFADRVLVNADSIRDWLIGQGYQASRIVVIKNGIDLSQYDGSRVNPTLRDELGIPASAPIVVMLSRLNPQKGVDDFIKAAALIKRRHPDTYFLIVGEKLDFRNDVFSTDAAYHRELGMLTRDLGMQDRIIFTGHRTDIPELLAETTVSVLPSYSEGLSNTLLESMAAGVPIVTTNVGGNAELVKEGITGFLVKPQAPGMLAEAIGRLLDDPKMAKRFGEQARSVAFQNFSMERMVKLTQELYFSEMAAVK